MNFPAFVNYAKGKRMHASEKQSLDQKCLINFYLKYFASLAPG